MKIRTILVPTDFSEQAEAARLYAFALAGEFSSRVHLLHVVAPPYLYDAWGTEAATLRMVDLLVQVEESAAAQLRKLVPAKGRLAGRVVAATTTGIAVDQILSYAVAKRVDLIVMGTHGRGVVGHMLLGSVAERVVHRAHVPVVLMPPTRPGAAGRRPRPRRVSR